MTTMKVMTAAHAKNNFGIFIDTAQREPVIVTKKNRPIGVFLSIRDLESASWRETALTVLERVDATNEVGYTELFKDKVALKEERDGLNDSTSRPHTETYASIETSLKRLAQSTLL